MKTTRSCGFLLLVLAMILPVGLALLGQISPLRLLDGLNKVNLSGVTNPAKPPHFVLQTFFSRDMQSAMEPWLVEKMGRPRELFLRLNNGFDFLLGRSNVGISIGPYRVLNGKGYV